MNFQDVIFVTPVKIFMGVKSSYSRFDTHEKNLYTLKFRVPIDLKANFIICLYYLAIFPAIFNASHGFVKGGENGKSTMPSSSIENPTCVAKASA